MTATENSPGFPPVFDNLPDGRRVGVRLHAFSNMIAGSYYSRTEVEFGVSLSEWRVLQAALETPGAAQSEVAHFHGLSAMTVSRAVAGLRRKGLIEIQTDPDDRRRSLIHPSDLGRDVGADIADRALQMYQHVFAELSATELAFLDDLMARVNGRIMDENFPEPLPATDDWAAKMAAHQDDSRPTGPPDR